MNFSFFFSPLKSLMRCWKQGQHSASGRTADSCGGCEEEEVHSASTDQTDGLRVSWEAGVGLISDPAQPTAGKGLHQGRWLALNASRLGNRFVFPASRCLFWTVEELWWKRAPKQEHTENARPGCQQLRHSCTLERGDCFEQCAHAYMTNHWDSNRVNSTRSLPGCFSCSSTAYTGARHTSSPIVGLTFRFGEVL